MWMTAITLETERQPQIHALAVNTKEAYPETPFDTSLLPSMMLQHNLWLANAAEFPPTHSRQTGC